MPVDGFVTGLPKEEKLGPKNGKRSKSPAGSGVYQSAYFSSTNEIILLEPPLGREMAIEQVTPSNGRLFSDEPVITSWESAVVDLGPAEPTVEIRDQYVS
jgi:hypothetical protein